MTKKPKVQKTPKGHEIPVPTKEEVLKVFEKATEPIKEKPSTPCRRPKK